jgi:hypothetical protein
MLEMKTVLRAVFAESDVRGAGDGIEISRRRAITISPGRGARTLLVSR